MESQQQLQLVALELSYFSKKIQLELEVVCDVTDTALL